DVGSLCCREAGSPTNHPYVPRCQAQSTPPRRASDCPPKRPRCDACECVRCPGPLLVPPRQSVPCFAFRGPACPLPGPPRKPRQPRQFPTVVPGPASAAGKDSHDRLPPIGSAFRSPPACADSLPWPATLPVVVTRVKWIPPLGVLRLRISKGKTVDCLRIRQKVFKPASREILSPTETIRRNGLRWSHKLVMGLGCL